MAPTSRRGQLYGAASDGDQGRAAPTRLEGNREICLRAWGPGRVTGRVQQGPRRLGSCRARAQLKQRSQETPLFP